MQKNGKNVKNQKKCQKSEEMQKPPKKHEYKKIFEKKWKEKEK